MRKTMIIVFLIIILLFVILFTYELYYNAIYNKQIMINSASEDGIIPVLDFYHSILKKEEFDNLIIEIIKDNNNLSNFQNLIIYTIKINDCRLFSYVETRYKEIDSMSYNKFFKNLEYELNQLKKNCN